MKVIRLPCQGLQIVRPAPDGPGLLCAPPASICLPPRSPAPNRASVRISIALPLIHSDRGRTLEDETGGFFENTQDPGTIVIREAPLHVGGLAWSALTHRAEGVPPDHQNAKHRYFVRADRLTPARGPCPPPKRERSIRQPTVMKRRPAPYRHRRRDERVRQRGVPFPVQNITFVPCGAKCAFALALSTQHPKQEQGGKIRWTERQETAG